MVDNGSTDGSIERIRGEKHLKLILMGRNTGFAYACNIGAAYASADTLLFLNQDAEIYKDALTKVFDFLTADKKRGIVSGKIIYPDGRLQETIRRFPGYMSFLFGRRSPLTKLFPKNRWTARYLYLDSDFQKPHRIDSCTGMFMLVRKKAFQALRGFDEGFFFYVEDLDFCIRAAKAGYETWYLPTKVAMHHLGENLNSASDRAYVKMHHYKGIYRFIIKHKNPGFLLRGLVFLATGLSIVLHILRSRISR